MKPALSWVWVILLKTLATTLIFAVLFYFVSGQSDSVWGVTVGFGAGMLIFQFVKAALDRRQARAGRA